MHDCLNDRAKKTEHQIRMMIRTEQSYINTKHEEFAMQKGEDLVPTRVIRRGPLTVMVKEKEEQGYCLLTNKGLNWFSDPNEEETVFVFPLEGLRINESSQQKNGLLGKAHGLKKNSFALFHETGRKIYRDVIQVVFVCSSEVEVDAWRDSFHKVGVIPVVMAEGSGRRSTGDFNTFVDLVSTPAAAVVINPHDAEVEKIRKMVNSYTKIITRKIKDHVPKLLCCYLILEVLHFVRQELDLLLRSDVDSLMEEQGDEVERRKTALKTYRSIKDAIAIINEEASKSSDVE